MEKKFSRSDLFWPDSNPEQSKKPSPFGKLGLEVLSKEESETYHGSLISSMVYFEQAEFNLKRHLQKNQVSTALDHLRKYN